jgi:hypothetical protein
MNDPDSQFAHKLTRHLDRGAADLRSGTVYRLQQARAAAHAGVSRSPATRPELAVAGAHGGSGPSDGSAKLTPRRVLGAVLLIAALGFGAQQWRALQQVHEYEELDLHLLASDLPVDAYLDSGFQNWLRTTFDY